jgi:hypothetical protein
MPQHVSCFEIQARTQTGINNGGALHTSTPNQQYLDYNTYLATSRFSQPTIVSIFKQRRKCKLDPKG